MRSSTPGHWDRYWRERQEIEDVYDNEERILAVVDDLDLADRWVLEVGAGSGRDSLRLAQRGARVVMLDYVMSAFDVIRPQAAAAGARVFCVCGDGTRMPFREGAFALVFHQGLLEHFRDPRPLLQENYRVTAAGGHCLVDVPQRYHPYTLAKHAMILLGRWFAGWETEFSPGELKGCMRQVGFEIARLGGDWMVPGFGYRSLRYALMRARIATLPKYPRPLWPFGPLLERWRAWLRRRRLGPYTFAMVNVLGRRPVE